MNLPFLIIGVGAATALAITMLREAADEQPERLPQPPKKKSICFRNEAGKTECYDRPLTPQACARLTAVAAGTPSPEFAIEIATAMAEDGCLPIPPIPRTPRPRVNPGQLPALMTDFKVPPQEWPIPGGSYIEGIGWCPPGMVYNLATKLCETQFATTQGTTGACCDSCAAGGPCTGCK